MQEKKPNTQKSMLSIKDQNGFCYFNSPTNFPPEKTTYNIQDIMDLENSGDDLCNAGRYLEALDAYTNALTKRTGTDPDRWNSLVNLSVPLTQLNRHQEALDALIKAKQELVSIKRDDLLWIVEERIEAINKIVEQSANNQKNNMTR